MSLLPHGASASRRGTALAMALILCTVVAVIGAGYLQLTSSLSRRQASAVDLQKAFYLAEAGLAEAFQAVRIGRSGQIGSEAEPAVYGEGLLWVDAVDTADGNVRLECTGMCGMGRTTLAFVVEPVELPLGFFADEDLVVESVLMVDGFDSSEQSYEQAVGVEEVDDPNADYSLRTLAEVRVYAAELERMIGSATLERLVLSDVAAIDAAMQAQLGLSDFHAHKLNDNLDEFRRGVSTGKLTFGSEPAPATTDGAGAEPVPMESAQDGTALADSSTAPTSSSGEHTSDGGLLGSNGSVHFTMPSGEPVAIWGDVTPGPAGSVTGLDRVQVSGSTEPRPLAVELPTVELPAVDLGFAVRHDDLLPMLIPSGTSGYESVVIAADAEIVLRGPATVVIGELVLEPGAKMTLDTMNGDIALYITTAMDLQPGSRVETSSDMPDQASVQVGAVPDSPGDPAIKLDGGAQFHGTVYAPDADVRIGSDFEIYGGVVARRLEIGAGARLHFDSAGFDGTPIPRILSWRVTEIPAAARGRRGDPFQALGVEKSALSELADAHELASVWMTLTYVDLGGTERSFEGPEDEFDWTDVLEVVSVDRDATRKKEDATADDQGGPDESPPDEPTSGIRIAVADALASLSDTALRDFLIDSAPLNDEELLAFYADDKMAADDEKSVLIANSPLSDAFLTNFLVDKNDFGRGRRASVLVANSPLSPEVLQLVVDAPMTLLRDSDKAAVLAAQ